MGKNRANFYICFLTCVAGFSFGMLFSTFFSKFVPKISEINCSSVILFSKSMLKAIILPSKLLLIIFAASYTLYILPIGITALFIKSVFIAVNVKDMMQFNSFTDKIISSAYVFCSFISIWMILCAVCKACRFQRANFFYSRTSSELLFSGNSFSFIGDYIFLSGISLIFELGANMIISIL